MNNMNPMMGMNPMGMNNLPNFDMDETAQNIKNIIQPYENKIRELEEIIKQKDFEIVVLKQKLNKNNNSNIPNLNNQMGMGMNPMMVNPMMMDPMMVNPMMMNPMMVNPMMMDPMGMNQMEMNPKEISILLKWDKKEYNVKCFENDKISKIKEKFNINKGFLVYCYQALDIDKTFQEYGIKEFCVIHAKSEVWNVLFDYRMEKYGLVLDPDCPIGLALIFFCMKFGEEEKELIFKAYLGIIRFVYTLTMITIHSKDPIKSVFLNGAKITVLE